MNVIDSADLWFPGYPIGRPHNAEDDGRWWGKWDRLRYVVWVDPGRPGDELAPRVALHVEVAA